MSEPYVFEPGWEELRRSFRLPANGELGVGYTPLPVLPQHVVFVPFDGDEAFLADVVDYLDEAAELHTAYCPDTAAWENEGGALCLS